MSDTVRSAPSGQENVLLEVLGTVTSAASTKESAEDKEGSKGPRFPRDVFFTEWFRNRGSIYYFLFKKNHKVTNIQVAELVALLRTYRSDCHNQISFLSIDGYKEALGRIAESFERGNTDNQRKHELLDKQFGSIIRNLGVIDVMFGSCVVYLPPGVETDLKAVCSRSGYIHSCGRNVYIRNIYKSDKEELYGKIDKYLERYHQHKRLLFRPFSHEDFTYYDRDQKDELRDGLDNVKLSVQKYFLGEKRIADVIEEMRARFRGRLVIPLPGDYHNDVQTISDERKSADFEPRNCLFLVMDHSTRTVEQSGGTEIRGDRHFVICYDQECVNENPFHLFDENKPAWFDHTTLPHTLAGAMINISRPFWPKRGPTVVCDCFVGSGTALLEASKFDGVNCFGLDFEPISQLLVEDNLEFFSLTSGEVQSYADQLEVVAGHLTQNRPSPADKKGWRKSVEGKSLASADKLYRAWEKRRSFAPQSSAQLVSALRRKSLFVRLLFYTLLKGARRYEAAISGGTFDLYQALHEELVKLLEEFQQLIGLRKRTERPFHNNRRVTFQGSYSEGISISIAELKKLSGTLPKKIEIRDCREWSPRACY